MTKQSTLIKRARMDHEEFDALVQEYCPELTRRRDLLGGFSYGESYFNSYLRDGVSDLLIQRLLERIKKAEETQ